MSSQTQGNRKMQTYIRGGLLGLVVGLLAAHLYTRAAEETNASEGAVKVGAMDIVKVSLAILTLVRQITELGTGNNK